MRKSKNPGVITVEDELEKALYKQGYISPCNYGVLQKIAWSRASRTDKKVSASMNLISCKLHYYADRDLNYIIDNLNKELPEDIKIITLIEVSGSFDAKDCTNNREYHYLLPSFCLKPKILIKEGENIIDLDFKISNEYKEKIQNICSLFRGTKKYHNYTKQVTFESGQAQRIIFEVTCHEILEIEGIEFIKFKLIGQSFLYNQIRKMIGMVIEVLRDSKSVDYFNESFTATKMETPKAPAEGLYLYKIDYSRYNNRKNEKKNNIELKDEDYVKVDEFSKLLRTKVYESESKDKVFSNWLTRFDKKENNVF